MAISHTQDWGSSYEAIPADGDDASEGAQRIRNLKRDIRERLAVDHYMELAANSDTADGRHKKVTLVQQNSEPTNAASEAYLYGYNKAGICGLHYMNSNGATIGISVSASRVVASLSADQDIPNNSMTVAEFDTEGEDVLGEFNVGTNTFTAINAGTYLVTSSIEYSEGLIGECYASTRVYVNGTNHTGSRTVIPDGVTSGADNCISVLVVLAASETINIRVKHTHGANRELDKTACRLGIFRVN